MSFIACETQNNHYIIALQILRPIFYSFFMKYNVCYCKSNWIVFFLFYIQYVFIYKLNYLTVLEFKNILCAFSIFLEKKNNKSTQK